jgi:hypothetical protein
LITNIAAWEILKAFTKYLLENMKERGQLADSGVDRIILNYILSKRSVEVWTRINCFNIGIVGRVLSIR